MVRRVSAMKRHDFNRKRAAASKLKEPIRTLLREEGKLVHGTRGKPTRGPRGNKR
jgi:hypothetical protein